MKVVKVITENGYTMTHHWYFDDFGFKRNSFDLFHEKTRTHYPFFGDLRVQNYDRDKPIIEGDDVSPYTDEQYLEMLIKMVEKISLL